MSVYTHVEFSQLQTYLQTHYAVGDLHDLKGISSGIENTNYFVTTSTGQFVLTLFEILTAQELPYFLNLMAYFSDQGIPSAAPVTDNHQQLLRELNTKPMALVAKLTGSEVKQPNETHCHVLGNALAKMHKVSEGFTHRRDNPRGAIWRQQTAKRLQHHLKPVEQQLLNDEFNYQQQFADLSPLPKGVIHADLFRDNALFNGDKLMGIIDFYYACDGVFLYDVAVTVNDWCMQANGQLDPLRLSAFLAGYQQQRAFTRDEHAAWSAMLRAAACRFWLSRLQDWHSPREGELTHSKNPDTFKHILQHHMTTPSYFE